MRKNYVQHELMFNQKIEPKVLTGWATNQE